MRLGFIGAGNMAGAIIGGVTGQGLMSAQEIGVFDIDKNKLEDFRKRGFAVFKDALELVSASDSIVIAVKPQNVKEVLSEIKSGMSDEKLLISIAAGVTAKSIKDIVGFNCKVVLAMPNTPLLLGCGATALSFTPPVTQKDFDFAKDIFSSCGIVEQVPPDKMNEIIPVNGSSPAFFYYFIKLITESAEKSGIDRETACRLASETMIGSAKMILESGKPPQELIDMVCSPKGTTLAGMEALKEHGFPKAVGAASLACIKRAYELSALIGD